MGDIWSLQKNNTLEIIWIPAEELQLFFCHAITSIFINFALFQFPPLSHDKFLNRRERRWSAKCFRDCLKSGKKEGKYWTVKETPGNYIKGYD